MRVYVPRALRRPGASILCNAWWKRVRTWPAAPVTATFMGAFDMVGLRRRSRPMRFLVDAVFVLWDTEYCLFGLASCREAALP